MLTPLSIAAVVGYLLGSLPFGYLVARAKGVNIFKVGSKSSGATNVRRVLGSGPGNFVFVLDVLKGAAAAGWPLIWLYGWLLEADQAPGGSGMSIALCSYMAVSGLVGALVGHSYSCFTRFRGGKGVATGAGGMLVILPAVTLIAVLIWAIAFFTSRYVSLASICAALSLPITAFFLNEDRLLLGLATVVAVFVVVRHRANLGRLLNGTETRFVKKSEEKTDFVQ